MKTRLLTKESTDFATCREIRRIVFIEEQNIPETRERDDLDYYSVHYLFLTDEGVPFGTARSRIENTYSKVERFAFLPEYRGQGLGPKAFAEVISDCFQRYPYTPIVINAQEGLEGLFAGLGFVIEGHRFVDAGIWHYRMRLEAPQEMKKTG